MAERRNWIIGYSGTEADDVITYIVSGTPTQVKKHLLLMIKEDTAEDDTFDYGTMTLKDIAKRADGSYYGYAVFGDHHNDYTATPLMDSVPLDNRGKITLP